MIDRQSGTWRDVVRETEAMRERDRSSLEHFGTDPAKADWLRGRISLANEILALPELVRDEE